MNKTLEQFQTDMILAAKKGFPILLSGSIIFLLFTFLPFVLPFKPVCLIWILGMSAMFPFGLVLCKLMNIHLLSTDNPLSVLGGMIAAAQTFFIPVFILVYRHMPEYLPFTIGLLGGSHFLPYMWIYRSKAYLFITLGTCSSALILGGYFVEQAFTLVPLATSIVYAIGILLIFKELKTDAV